MVFFMAGYLRVLMRKMREMSDKMSIYEIKKRCLESSLLILLSLERNRIIHNLNREIFKKQCDNKEDEEE